MVTVTSCYNQESGTKKKCIQRPRQQSEIFVGEIEKRVTCLLIPVNLTAIPDIKTDQAAYTNCLLWKLSHAPSCHIVSMKSCIWPGFRNAS